jgi:putative flippase GtrA
MRQHAHTARDLLIPVIDFFYPPFRKIIDLRTFRYVACGGGNTLLGLIVYSVTFKFVLHERLLDLGFFAFEPHTASLFISFLINFPMGFFLMKFVVFEESNIKGRIQLFRYFLLYVACLFLNYPILKFFVEWLHWNAIVSQVVTTGIIVVFSYLVQKHFTFRVVQNKEVIN